MSRSAADSKVLEYKDTISQLNMVISNQNALIASLQKTIELSNEKTDKLQEQIEYLTQKLFGTSSEKTKSLEGQLSLFDEAEQEASKPPIQEETVAVKEHTRNAKRTGEEIFKGVTVDNRLIPLTEDQLICDDCGSPMVIVGKEYVRQEFQYTPAKGTLIRYFRQTAKCPVCYDSETLEENIKFVKSVIPEPLIPHSYASSSVVAYVMYQKYANALPLYRQEKDFEQMGVSFQRATLANWIIFCSENYFLPMYDFFHRELLRRRFLMADETRVQVLNEPERKAETDSFMWLFRSGEDGLPPIILYHYTETRARFHAEEFLKGFSGYLETDGYQGYNDLPRIKRCCCFAHLRRYFIEAIPKGKELDYSNPAAQGVQYCNRLFEQERVSREKGHTYEQRKEHRQKKEAPILDAFLEWLGMQTPKKGSRLEKAVNYALNRKELFRTYLEDGRCSFSNNLSENAIRPFTVGRKNWLFSDTPKGATASAITYTIVEMAKAHNLNIYKYLNFLLEKRPSSKMTEEELDQLAPWNKDVIAGCATPM